MHKLVYVQSLKYLTLNILTVPEYNEFMHEIRRLPLSRQYLLHKNEIQILVDNIVYEKWGTIINYQLLQYMYFTKLTSTNKVKRSIIDKCDPPIKQLKFMKIHQTINNTIKRSRPYDFYPELAILSEVFN